ncbi:MAG: sigma-54-dependent transcriptional regulator [Gammaproteobacteria bacterium]|jgi:two-component system nitrogen regulation response regulator NtrX
MSIGNILVVDDEPDICSLIKDILDDEGFNVTIAENAEEAQSAIQASQPILVLLDIWMPDTDGITLLKEWTTKEDFNTPVIIMSGHGTVETAVEATRLGAYDFLEKPLSMAKLVLTVKNAIKTSLLEKENEKLKRQDNFPIEIIGKSEVIENIRRLIERIADHNTPILIIGEAGCDKEAIARYIHNNSSRKNEPFITVNISALNSEDPASEIFGKYINGNLIPGYLDEAKNGTLFLKDIIDLDAISQAKLQDTIDKSRFTRVGGGTSEPLTARFIASTSNALVDAIREEKFRGDLYYQLNVLQVIIPALSEHFEDIPELLEYYVNLFVAHEKLPYRHFSTSAQNRLRMYGWPGNIRELKNLVQRLLILGQSDVIEVNEVESALGEQSGFKADNGLRNFDLPLRDAREKFERAYLEYQLKQANGSVSKIAQTVGMERTHLYRKLKMLGINIKN